MYHCMYDTHNTLIELIPFLFRDFLSNRLLHRFPLMFMHSLHMLSTMCTLPESFLAKRARKRSFSSMNPNMCLQRTRLIERLCAILTFPRFLVGMDTNVSFQRALLRKFPLTNLALPRTIGIARLFLGGALHHHMRVDMELQRRVCLKPVRVANVALELLHLATGCAFAGGFLFDNHSVSTAICATSSRHCARFMLDSLHFVHWLRLFVVVL
mmetsp:Transcript_62909/g.99873  ORF Transcript_62909/g.99873 Transcript_62909/m.99873 type:complete len:212 (+) Transcript_62909:475-1110(+)